MYNQEPPQQESSVYVDDDGAPPFPNPSNPVPPPQMQVPPQPAPQVAHPVDQQGQPVDLEAVAKRLLALPGMAQYLASMGQPHAVNAAPIPNARPVEQPTPRPDVNHEAAAMRKGLDRVMREVGLLRQIPIDVLLQAASHMVDVAQFVVAEYAKLGKTITLRQALLATNRMIDAADGQGLFDLLGGGTKTAG